MNYIFSAILAILSMVVGCSNQHDECSTENPATTQAVSLPCDNCLFMSSNMSSNYLFCSVFANFPGEGENPYCERDCGFVDLNGDGNDDLILSLPISHAGTGGNAYDIILSEEDHYRHIGQICGNSILVEDIPDEPRTIWAYSHSSASTGTLVSMVIDYGGAIITKGNIPIVTGDESIGSEILNLIHERATHPIKWKRSRTIDGIVHW